MSDSPSPLRWAILGTGFISHTVIDAIGQSDGSEIVTIAGRNEEVLRDFCTRYSIPRYDVGYGEDVLGATDVDVVYIGLPNHKHAELTIACARAGKAVLSEKSLTTTMDDAHALIGAVKQQQIFFVEGLMYLAHPMYERIAETLTDGRLGEVRSIRGSYAANIGHLVNPDGKGTLYNLGCYPASLLQFVVQTVFGDEAFARRQLVGVGSRAAADGNVVEAALSVRFDNGLLASLQSSDNYGNGSEFAVSGDSGTLRWLTNPWLPAAGENILRWEPFEGEAETIIVEDSHDAFYHQIKMVEHHVNAGDAEAARPSPRLADSLEIMKLLTDWEALI